MSFAVWKVLVEAEGGFDEVVMGDIGAAGDGTVAVAGGADIGLSFDTGHEGD